jgi:hypothetical protein
VSRSPRPFQLLAVFIPIIEPVSENRICLIDLPRPLLVCLCFHPCYGRFQQIASPFPTAKTDLYLLSIVSQGIYKRILSIVFIHLSTCLYLPPALPQEKNRNKNDRIDMPSIVPHLNSLSSSTNSCIFSFYRMSKPEHKILMWHCGPCNH